MGRGNGKEQRTGLGCGGHALERGNRPEERRENWEIRRGKGMCVLDQRERKERDKREGEGAGLGLRKTWPNWAWFFVLHFLSLPHSSFFISQLIQASF